MGPMPDAAGAALAASHAQAQHSQSDGTALKAMAGAGELRFEPAAEERCAQVCQEAADKVEDSLRMARRLQRVNGFGDTSAGQQLATKFRGKADEALRVLRRTARCCGICGTPIGRRVGHMPRPSRPTRTDLGLKGELGGFARPNGSGCRIAFDDDFRVQ